METVDERTFKEKMNAFVEKGKDKVRDAAKFIKDNPASVSVICAGIVGGSRIISKTISAYSAKKQMDLQMRRIYDRSLGRYIELRRPLTTKEAIELEARRMNGEKMTMILDSMGLVK